MFILLIWPHLASVLSHSLHLPVLAVGRRPSLPGSPYATWQPTRAAGARVCKRGDRTVSSSVPACAQGVGAHFRASLPWRLPSAPQGHVAHLLSPSEGGPCLKDRQARQELKCPCKPSCAPCQSLSLLHLSMEDGHLHLQFKSQQGCSQDLEL